MVTDVPALVVPLSALIGISCSVTEPGQILLDSSINSKSSETDWDYIVLNAEWGTGVDMLETYVLSSPFGAPAAQYAGYIGNDGQRALTLDDVLSLYDSGRVWVASGKYAHDREYARLIKMLRRTEDVCCAATHGAYAVYGLGAGLRTEVCNDGRLLKAFDSGNGDDDQIVFELQVHVEGQQQHQGDEGVMSVSFRAWSRWSHAVECECRFRTGPVDGDRTTVESL